MRAPVSPHNVIDTNTAGRSTSRGRRIFTAVIAAGAFAGLSGLVAPAATAQNNIGGRIGDEYVAASAANGQSPAAYFGPATSNERDAARGGKFQTFSNDKSIYWHPLVSDGRANQVGGAIFTKWGEVSSPGTAGWEWGPLMYPTTREWSSRPSADSGKVARGNHFEGGTVYWVPNEGTYVTWGLLRDAWWAIGAEDSRLGLPLSDERRLSTGWEQDFEGGVINVDLRGRVTIMVYGPRGEREEVQGPVAIQGLVRE